MLNLFQRREFTSHSLLPLTWKVECNALQPDDWKTLAHIVAGWNLKFGRVIPIMYGGLPFAVELEPFVTPECETALIVDDVLTTGRSFEAARRGLIDPLGVVAFARTAPPDWVRPVWQLSADCDRVAPRQRLPARPRRPEPGIGQLAAGGA